MSTIDDRTPALQLPLPHPANKLQDDVQRLRAAVNALDAAVAAIDAGAITAAERAKLQSVAAGATVNATDAALRARSTHTGTQAMGTIDGLAAALDGKQGKPASLTYTWNPDGTLASTTSGGVTATYAWHADGRLNTVTTPTQTSTYNWNASNPQQLDGVTVTGV